MTVPPFHLERQTWLANPLVASVLPLISISALLIASAGWADATAFERFAMTLGALVPVALLVVAASTGLEVAVDTGGVTIHPRPFRAQRVPLEDVVDTRVVQFDPLHDHGGWGVRHDAAGRVYTVRGDRALRLDLTDGHHVLVGSRDPDLLQAALHEARRT